MLDSPAVRAGLALALATGVYGLSFGALGTTAGLSVAQAMALSLLMFTGGSQFAFVGVVAGGGGGGAATVAATLLSLRNGVYAVQLNALLAPRGRLRTLAHAHLTIDESAAVSTGQPDPVEQRRGFWATGVGVFVCWNLATLAGALLGESIGDPRTFGLDGAAVAAFLALLWPRLRGRQPVAIAVVCAVVTVVAVPWLAPGLPILAAGGVAVLLHVAQTVRSGR